MMDKVVKAVAGESLECLTSMECLSSISEIHLFPVCQQEEGVAPAGSWSLEPSGKAEHCRVSLCRSIGGG